MQLNETSTRYCIYYYGRGPIYAHNAHEHHLSLLTFDKQ